MWAPRTLFCHSTLLASYGNKTATFPTHLHTRCKPASELFPPLSAVQTQGSGVHPPMFISRSRPSFSAEVAGRASSVCGLSCLACSLACAVLALPYLDKTQLVFTDEGRLCAK